MSITNIGLKKLEAIVMYSHDLDRSRRFYVDQLDFAEIGGSDEHITREGGQKTAVFQAGECTVLVEQPVRAESRAARYLRKHPQGVGALVFEVEDIEHTFSVLEKRGATPISEVITHHDDHGSLHTFSITTPLGGTTFRFVERQGYGGLFPGFKARETTTNSNRFGFQQFDHVTSNFETMKPALLWMEHVLGFEAYWDIEFHTNDVAPNSQVGSGLRSQVMWDRHSGIKFANNEPWRPFFKASQINIFAEDHRGDGIQHVAMTVGDIITSVDGLRQQAVNFMETPSTYYAALPQRIVDSGIGSIDENIAELQALGILVDGDKDKSYMLQIFLQDAAEYHQDEAAGPFFYEIIQRKGDRGFGGGNFRALFESIERAQTMTGRL